MTSFFIFKETKSWHFLWSTSYMNYLCRKKIWKSRLLQIHGLLQFYVVPQGLTHKASITTAADDKFCDIFPNFRKKNKVWYFMRIVCQQTILMKYHALFVIF